MSGLENLDLGRYDSSCYSLTICIIIFTFYIFFLKTIILYFVLFLASSNKMFNVAVIFSCLLSFIKYKLISRFCYRLYSIRLFLSYIHIHTYTYIYIHTFIDHFPKGAFQCQLQRKG